MKNKKIQILNYTKKNPPKKLYAQIYAHQKLEIQKNSNQQQQK